MPSKPARPCSQPSCPNLTHERLCPERTRAEDARYRRWQRDSKVNRRHGTRWRKMRAAYITARPLCEDCLAADRCTPVRRRDIVVFALITIYSKKHSLSVLEEIYFPDIKKSLKSLYCYDF